MTTLDGVEREIPSDSLLIWDSERPVAVAGVMGGLDTEVKETTKDIFIESAYFEPRSVRRTSKTLGLKTESSYRFERGTDIKMLKKALDRAAYLVREAAGGTIYGKIDVYPRRYYPPEVTVRHEKVNAVLGLSLSGGEIAGCLRRLGLDTEEGNGSVTVKTPTFRGDIIRDVDLIEEVARVYGYERIPARLPAVPLGFRGMTGRAREALHRELRESLLKLGFNEAINYSFMGTADLDLLQIGGDDERRRLVRIKNPLRVEDSFMRTTLVPGLVRNLLHNLAHGNRDLRIFELSKVFIARDGEPLPEERRHVALLSYREKAKALYPDETADFYVLKGLVETILGNLRVRDLSFARSSEPFLHPGQSADILVSGATAGFCGVLSPGVVSSLDIKAQKPSVLVMELDLSSLMPYVEQQTRYRALPKYPFIERDSAVVLDASVEASALLDVLRSRGSGLIEEISIFDVYQGGSISPGKKSLAFRVRYRASDRTLTDEEIEAVHGGLVTHLLEKTGGQLRQ
jgi:phenylalanyl-tRNA synthetase beta chain